MMKSTVFFRKLTYTSQKQQTAGHYAASHSVMPPLVVVPDVYSDFVLSLEGSLYLWIVVQFQDTAINSQNLISV